MVFNSGKKYIIIHTIMCSYNIEFLSILKESYDDVISIVDHAPVQEYCFKTVQDHKVLRKVLVYLLDSSIIVAIDYAVISKLQYRKPIEWAILWGATWPFKFQLFQIWVPSE